MVKNYTIYRFGKCVRCGHNVKEIIGDVEAETQEDAIDKAINNWSYENFGQGGAMRENDKIEEEIFLNAKFIAEENRGE